MTPPVARSRVAAGVAGLAVLAGIAVTGRLSRHVWFFGDDWNFLLHRSLSDDTLSTLFAPHNEHWSTVPVLVFRFLYGVVGVRHYLAYAAPVLVAHAVVCATVWVLCRRAGARPWAATAAVVVLAFPGAGAEDVLWDFQIGFVASVAFGLLAVWAAGHDGRHRGRDAVAVTMSVLAFASSGMGVVVWVLLAVLVVARRGVRAAVVVAGIPAAVFVVWFLTWGRTAVGGDTATSVSAYYQLPEFLWRGLATAWGNAAGYLAAGPALVLAAAVGAVVLAARRPAVVPGALRRLTIAGLGTAVFLYLFIGVSRVRFGTDQAEASRYAYVAVVLGAFALAAAVTAVLPRALTPVTPVDRDDRDEDEPGRDAEVGGPGAGDGRHTNPALVVALVVVAALVAVSGVRQLIAFADSRAGLLATARPQVVGAVVLAREGAPFLSEYPEPVYDPDVTMSVLRDPGVQAAFGPVSATPQGLVDARARVQLEATPRDPGLPAPGQVTWSGVTGSPPTSTGCASGSAGDGAYVDVSPGSGGRAQIRLAGPTAGVALVLVADGRASSAVGVQVPSAGVWIATVADAAVTRVVLSRPGPVTVCVD